MAGEGDNGVGRAGEAGFGVEGLIGPAGVPCFCLSSDGVSASK